MARKPKTTVTVTTPQTANQVGSILKNSKIEDVKGGKLVVKYKKGKMKKARVLSFFIAPTMMEEEIEAVAGLLVAATKKPKVKVAKEPAAKKPAEKKEAAKPKKAAKKPAKTKTKADPKTPKVDKLAENAETILALFDKDAMKFKDVKAASGIAQGPARMAVNHLIETGKLTRHGKTAKTSYTLPGVELPAEDPKTPAKKDAAKKSAKKKAPAKPKDAGDPRTTGTSVPNPDEDEANATPPETKKAPAKPKKPGTKKKGAAKKEEAEPKTESVDDPETPADDPPADAAEGQTNNWANVKWTL